jgi:hypothetical protein
VISFAAQHRPKALRHYVFWLIPLPFGTGAVASSARCDDTPAGVHETTPTFAPSSSGAFSWQRYLDLAIMGGQSGAMDAWEKRHASAQNHVNVVRSAIDRQRSIVARQKALRLNTQASEELLAAIEHSQEIFEGNLARILQERV